MGSRVFVVKELDRPFDMSSAAYFGAVQTLLGPDSNKSSVMNTSTFVRSVSKAFDDVEFDSEDDCLCVVGQIIPVSIAVAVAFNKYDVVNLLLYDSTTSTYQKKRVSSTSCLGEAPWKK